VLSVLVVPGRSVVVSTRDSVSLVALSVVLPEAVLPLSSTFPLPQDAKDSVQSVRARAVIKIFVFCILQLRFQAFLATSLRLISETAATISFSDFVFKNRRKIRQNSLFVGRIANKMRRGEEM
jgi:hypothetical protein